MTSTLLSRRVNVSKYGLIYASGGKNLGPAGFCTVIIRNDLLERGAAPQTPSVLDYKKMATSTPIPSIYNTPPTFLLYMASLIFDEFLAKGGLSYMEQRAIRRANQIYSIIDQYPNFYVNNVNPEFRSRMNVPLR
jgi:phosphoserine aminotransferase